MWQQTSARWTRSARPAAPHRRSARSTTVRRAPAGRRPDRPRAAGLRSTTRRADDAAPGCGPRPAPRRVRWRTPRGVGSMTDRERTCTRGLRPGRDAHHATSVQRCRDRGFARSSRQTVTALGPTSLQHGLATARTHTGTEPMLLGPTAVIGLERALHVILLTGTATAVRRRHHVQCRMRHESRHRHENFLRLGSSVGSGNPQPP